MVNFGHLARTAPEEDHHRVIAIAPRPPTDCRKPVERRVTMNHLVEIENEDVHIVQPQNFWAPYVMEEGKRQGYLATSRQCGNALLGVGH